MKKVLYLLTILLTFSCLGQIPPADFPDGVETKLIQLDTLTTAEKLALPQVKGTVVYDVTLNALQSFDGNSWVSGSGGGISDNIYTANGVTPDASNRFVDLGAGSLLGIRNADYKTYFLIDDNEIDIRNGYGDLRFRTGTAGTYDSNSIGDVWTATDAVGGGKWVAPINFDPSADQTITGDWDFNGFLTIDSVLFTASPDIGGNTITGVAAGTNPTDAVNKSQLDAVGVPTITDNQVVIGTGTSIEGTSNLAMQYNTQQDLLKIGQDGTTAGAINLYGSDGVAGIGVLRFYNNSNVDTNADYFGLGTIFGVGDFGIGTNTANALLIDDLTLGVTLPSTSISDIDALGGKAIITQEYADANYSSGGDVTQAGDNDFTGVNTFVNTSDFTTLQATNNYESVGSTAFYAVNNTNGGNAVVALSNLGTSFVSGSVTDTNGYHYDAIHDGSRVFSVDKLGNIVANSFTGDGSNLTGISSGHTIQENGTPLADRVNLNFVDGLIAEDNAGNTSTDVRLDTSDIQTYYPDSPIKTTKWVGTQAEYDIKFPSGHGTTDEIVCLDCPTPPLLSSDISDFDTEVSSNTSVAANTAKISFETSTDTGTTIDMSGLTQDNFGAASSDATFTMVNIAIGGYAEVLVKRTGAPTVTGATQFPNTATFIDATDMILCIKDFNGTRKYWFVEF